uniref:Trichohyalin-plectin-homology domain-containing protein n=1 Tax=Chromera velia CCMP2878 TaxID=1169474 RepID=A0A0G4I4S2_9ALVE|eukprot:Cvel_10997.t1-p1 / transcript=Cvel_10997.t1 / gene=Cvel_10997 / organism=Chromera_velia_CCMP2878 / gene_product=hypothetical protein / transcript_product=hypothetical protein / location=Cvel_scaffold677:48074-53317(-) / protein_length=349 / sequence_SO=supercontig / SO=protein_coding / is_pseudo=false
MQEESLRQQQRARAEEEEEQRRRAAAVEAVLAACRDAERQKKMRDDMKREIFRLEQERTRQMTEEEDRRLEAERQKAAAEAARRAAENAEQRDREAEWKRKRREQEARDAEEQNRQQKEMYDRMERMREAALQARLDKIQRINRSVGKALGDSMEAKARADEERMMKEVELREKRLTQLENEKRQKWAQAQRDMLDTLARQCEERKRQKEMEKMESDKQADIFRKTVKDGIEEDARKAEARRQRRWQQDQDLKSQIREARLTKWYQPISLTELEYNQNIFRDMAKGQILPAETLQSFLLPEDHKLTKKAYRNRMPGPKPDPTEAEGAGSLLEGGGRTEAEGAPTIVTFN